MPEQHWIADLGDGRYRNPVLFADWSDPDVIRVGADYYLVASSFNRVPGLPVLHSTDLVNWRILTHALDRLVPEEHYATPRPGCGVWAPSIRYHDGLFHICFPDPDHGISVTTARDPAGPWRAPTLVLPGRGLIDRCPLWTDDGAAYLVHAWARSRCGFNNRLTVRRMTPDLSRPLDEEGTVLVDGDAIPGCRTLEGPKWYHRDGWYWIFAPAGGVANGWQYALRSRQVWGPYEARVVLAQNATDVNGPHQGAWVDTPDGEEWFVHFQDRGAYGRVVHLQPVRHRAEGWPVIGTDDGTGRGTPVATHTKPGAAGKKSVPHAPACADRFANGRPGPQWTWPANPRPGWIARAEEPGTLRLSCRPAAAPDLRTVPNVLGQRLPGPRARITTGVRLRADDPGAHAGVVVLGHAYAWAGLERTPDGVRLVHRVHEGRAGDPVPHPGPAPESAPGVDLPADAHVRLAVTITDGAVVRFAADVDGTGWRELGEPFTAAPGGWVGATLGLFATASPGSPHAAGVADFDPFDVHPA